MSLLSQTSVKIASNIANSITEASERIKQDARKEITAEIKSARRESREVNSEKIARLLKDSEWTPERLQNEIEIHFSSPEWSRKTAQIPFLKMREQQELQERNAYKEHWKKTEKEMEDEYVRLDRKARQTRYELEDAMGAQRMLERYQPSEEYRSEKGVYDRVIEKKKAQLASEESGRKELNYIKQSLHRNMTMSGGGELLPADRKKLEARLPEVIAELQRNYHEGRLLDLQLEVQRRNLEHALVGRDLEPLPTELPSEPTVAPAEVVDASDKDSEAKRLQAEQVASRAVGSMPTRRAKVEAATVADLEI
ncbi:MAG: hypothetical protein ACK5PB_14045 [Pirellula sp.]|jgi:hypothetical protein